MVIFTLYFLVFRMQNTPPSSPMGSPNVSPMRASINNSGTPPRVLFGSPQKRPKTCPKAPTKQQKKADVLNHLPEFSPNSLKIKGKLGSGSFGDVFIVEMDPPNSPLFAMKEVLINRISPKDIAKEASHFGSPGCVPGFGMRSEDSKTYFGFSSIAVPLDKMLISTDNIENIISLLKVSVMTAPFPVITDANLENMGFLRAGTPTPMLGNDGLPCAGVPISEDCVCFIDLGNNDCPNDCNPNTSAIFDNDDVIKTDESMLKYRKFKIDMISALLRNKILQVKLDECDIARDICAKYGYKYAGGDRKMMR